MCGWGHGNFSLCRIGPSSVWRSLAGYLVYLSGVFRQPTPGANISVFMNTWLGVYKNTAEDSVDLDSWTWGRKRKGLSTVSQPITLLSRLQSAVGKNKHHILCLKTVQICELMAAANWAKRTKLAQSFLALISWHWHWYSVYSILYQMFSVLFLLTGPSSLVQQGNGLTDSGLLLDEIAKKHADSYTSSDQRLSQPAQKQAAINHSLGCLPWTNLPIAL